MWRTSMEALDSHMILNYKANTNNKPFTTYYKTIEYILLYIVFTLLAVQGKADGIGSQHRKILKSGSLDFVCQHSIIGPIVNCEFNIFNGKKDYLGVISSGNLTSSFKRFRQVQAMSYQTDFRTGKCGVTLEDMSLGRHVVGCRVRQARQGWVYSFVTVQVESVSGVSRNSLTLQQDHDVGSAIAVGTRAHYACSSTSSLTECTFFLLRSASYWVNKDDAKVRYRRNNETSGGTSCELWIVNVTSNDSGVVWCRGDTKDRQFREYRASTLMVAKPPTEPPELVLSKTSYVVGETLEATCTVMESVPPAIITWYWGDEAIVEDVALDVASDTWRWSWEGEERKQVLEGKQLTAEDYGKNVTCVASHVALPRSLRTSEVLPIAIPVAATQSQKLQTTQKTTTPAPTPTTPKTTTPTTTTQRTTTPTPTLTTPTPTTPKTMTPRITTPTSKTTAAQAPTTNMTITTRTFKYEGDDIAVSTLHSVKAGDAWTPPMSESRLNITTVVLSAGLLICFIGMTLLYLRISGRLCFRAAEPQWEPTVVATQNRATVVNINTRYEPNVENSTSIRAPRPLPRPGQEPRDSRVYNVILEYPEYDEIRALEGNTVGAVITKEVAVPIQQKEPNHYNEPYDHVFIPYLWPPPDRPLPPQPGTQPDEDDGYLRPKPRRKL